MTAGGLARVSARAAVLAVNWRTLAWAPFARELSAASSHIVLTEPVPDVLAEVGWTGGEALLGLPADAALLPHDEGRADRLRLGRRAR